jgi:4-hydroxy-2-oxoheptanedioate aldolase
MRPNAIKGDVLAGKAIAGAMVFEFFSPGMSAILANAGCRFVIYDMEHTGLGYETLKWLFASCRGLPIEPMVRVPRGEYTWLARALDLGARGVMIPMVESAEHARSIIEACRYPPAGRRGSALGSARASDYGMRAPEYRKAAADELLIVCQIESPKAVENIEAIAAVDGVDVLFIGPHDLSGTVGQLGDLKHPQVAKLIARAEEGIKRSGKPMGTVPHPGTTWREMFQRGYQMINAGSDVGRLRDAALAEVKEFRSVYP